MLFLFRIALLFVSIATERNVSYKQVLTRTLYVAIKYVLSVNKQIKTHDSESRGQEEAAVRDE